MKHRPLLQKIVIAVVVFLILASWWDRRMEARRRHQGALAIVEVSGPIRIGSSETSWGNPDADDIARRLTKLSDDKDVKAILLRINSPGGTVGAVQEIAREMARCRANGKIIVASLGEIAASGGYYLAAGSDWVVANPGTITGSIGVILQFGNMESLFQKIGLKVQVIKSGLHKDLGSPARPMTPEEKAMLQGSIDDAYSQFFEAVRQGRRLDPEKLKLLADGRIFTGRQAKEGGLVDELGDQEDAIQAAIRLAKLPAKPYRLEEDKKSFAAVLQRATSQLSNQPFESLRETVMGASVDYQWRP